MLLYLYKINMPIKYGDIIININPEKESIIDYLGRFFGNENSITDDDTIIILFDDQTICDTKNEYIDKKFQFVLLGLLTFLPYYFITNDSKTFYYKIPHNKNGKRTVNCSNIFKNHPNYATCKKEESFYNFIYYDNNFNDVFSIIKHGKNEKNIRHLLAYDDEQFKKDDIIYLVNCIFKNNFKK